MPHASLAYPLDAQPAREAQLSPEVAALRSSDLFAGQPAAALAALARAASVRHLGPGAVLVPEGRSCEQAVFVVRGRLRLVRQAESGREITLETFRAGDVFADQILGGGALRAGLIAGQSSLVVLVSREALVAHARAYPDTLLAILGAQARRLQRGHDLLTGMALGDVTRRVLWALGLLVRQEGQEVAEGFVLPQRPTQQELANSIGACRETVSRIVSDLTRQGLVTPRGKGLLVARAALEPGAGAC